MLDIVDYGPQTPSSIRKDSKAMASAEISYLVIRSLTKIFLALAIATAVYFISPVLLRRWISDKDGQSLPPGPPVRYAFLNKYAELALDNWAKKYGPMFSMWLGSQLFIVISDPHVARDLLVTNGAIFSSRKRYFMKNQVILRGRAITASEYGDKW